MGRKKENVLLKAILKSFCEEPKGKILDFGCSQGHYSLELSRMGFDVVGADVTDGFRYKDKIKFVQLAGKGPLPFENESFDFVLLAEVVEHLTDPYGLMRELSRILKRGGKVILSTPNILNIKSRCRFLSEGAYDYFREPPFDHVGHNVKTGIDISQVHVMPWRYHELEFLLKECGFLVEDISTSVYEGWGLSFFVPLIRFQLNSKAKRSLKKAGLDYRRINKIMLSKELLFGRHLILKATKQ